MTRKRDRGEDDDQGRSAKPTKSFEPTIMDQLRPNFVRSGDIPPGAIRILVDHIARLPSSSHVWKFVKKYEKNGFMNSVLIVKLISKVKRTQSHTTTHNTQHTTQQDSTQHITGQSEGGCTAWRHCYRQGNIRRTDSLPTRVPGRCTTNGGRRRRDSSIYRMVHHALTGTERRSRRRRVGRRQQSSHQNLQRVHRHRHAEDMLLGTKPKPPCHISFIHARVHTPCLSRSSPKRRC